MRSFSLVLVILVLAGSACFAQDVPVLKTRKDSVSYAIGINIGQSFKMQAVDIDVALLASAINAILAGQKTAMSEEDAGKCVIPSQQEAREKQGVKGKKFLEENKKKEGVKVTASGLQYKVITEGNGEIPKSTDKVKTHYTGKLIDGTEFDSSVKRGEPATFPV